MNPQNARSQTIFFCLRRERPREITFIPRFIPAFFNTQHAGGLVHTSHTPPSRRARRAARRARAAATAAPRSPRPRCLPCAHALSPEWNAEHQPPALCLSTPRPQRRKYLRQKSRPHSQQPTGLGGGGGCASFFLFFFFSSSAGGPASLDPFRAYLVRSLSGVGFGGKRERSFSCS